MILYRRQLGWADGMGALVFHGQRADVAEIFNLTNVFQVAEHYKYSRHVELKLMLGYAIGLYSGYLAGYSEGHYLLTEKGGCKQAAELQRRSLNAQDVWCLDPGDPRQIDHQTST